MLGEYNRRKYVYTGARHSAGKYLSERFQVILHLKLTQKFCNSYMLKFSAFTKIPKTKSVKSHKNTF